MQIKLASLDNNQVIEFLSEHYAHMKEISIPGTCNSLPLEKIIESNLSVYCAWENNQIIGCGGLYEVSSNHGEIKSMRTKPSHLRKGIGSAILNFITEQAIERGYSQLSLETGNYDSFLDVIKFYERHGFIKSPPFSNYIDDGFSYYMRKDL